MDVYSLTSVTAKGRSIHVECKVGAEHPHKLYMKIDVRQ